MEDAELYVKSSSLQQQLVCAVLDELWPALDWRHKEGAVLDVGCGPGDVTARQLLPRLPPGVTAVAADVCAAMIAKARCRFSGPRLHFCQLDIGADSIKDTSVWQRAPFTKVFSFFCLNWVQDQRLALRNIRELLTPGGETVLVLVSYTPLFPVYETLAKTSRWRSYMEDYRQMVTPYQHSEDPEAELRNYLQEAGFSVKMCRNERAVTYSSKDEENVIRMGTVSGATSSGLQRQFVSRVLRQLWHALDWRCEDRMALEVGCGCGDFSACDLVSRLPDDMAVLATDACPAAVASAADKHDGPRLCFLQLHIDAAHIEDTAVWRLAPFGKVFSFFGLHWVQDQRVAFQNISKLLSSGGEAVFIIITHSRLFAMYETMAMSSRWSIYMQEYLQFVTPYQKMNNPELHFIGYMEEVGLSIKKCRIYRDITYVSTDEQNIVDTVRSMNPFVGTMPKDMREPFIRDCVREAYRNDTLRSRRLPAGNNYSFLYDALVAHVKKP